MSDEEKQTLTKNTERLGRIMIYSAWLLAIIAISRGMYLQVSMPEVALNLLYSMFTGGIVLILGKKAIVEVLNKMVTWWTSKPR